MSSFLRKGHRIEYHHYSSASDTCWGQCFSKSASDIDCGDFCNGSDLRPTGPEVLKEMEQKESGREAEEKH